MNIKKLTKGVKKRQPDKERELYILLYENLFKVPLAYCADKEEATSVFNYSMVDIFKNIISFEDKQSLLKWAYKILKNDCIDHIRKKVVYRDKLLYVETNSLESYSSNDAISNLNMDEILNCINQLNDTYRLCFVMYELDGMTHQQIADKLNIKVNTSKWYLAEAKKKLRVIVRREGIAYYPRIKTTH